MCLIIKRLLNFREKAAAPTLDRSMIDELAAELAAGRVSESFTRLKMIFLAGTMARLKRYSQNSPLLRMIKDQEALS